MYLVQADIKYLDGALEGLEIPAGFRVTYLNNMRAYSVAAWLKKVHKANDFIRATGTGNRYQVTGNVSVTRI